MNPARWSLTIAEPRRGAGGHGRPAEVGPAREAFATSFIDSSRSLPQAVPSLDRSQAQTGLSGQPPRPGTGHWAASLSPGASLRRAGVRGRRQSADGRGVAQPVMSCPLPDRPDRSRRWSLPRTVRGEGCLLGLVRMQALLDGAGPVGPPTARKTRGPTPGPTPSPCLVAQCVAAVGMSGSGKRTCRAPGRAAPDLERRRHALREARRPQAFAALQRRRALPRSFQQTSCRTCTWR